MNEDSASIGNRLVLVMKHRGITITNLAYTLGVSKSSVSEWIRGGSLSLIHATNLAIELNVSLSWLLHGKGHMDLFGPIHPSSAEMLLIRQLRKAGNHTFSSFFSLLSNLAKPALGEDPVSQIMALDLLERSRIPMAMVSCDGFILDVNETCINILGDELDREKDVIGTHFLGWISEQDINNAMRHMKEGTHTSHNSRFFCQIRRKQKPGRPASRPYAGVVISSAFHGNPDDGHFQCLIHCID